MGGKTKEEFKFQCSEAVFLICVDGGCFPGQQPDVQCHQRPRNRQAFTPARPFTEKVSDWV